MSHVEITLDQQDLSNLLHGGTVKVSPNRFIEGNLTVKLEPSCIQKEYENPLQKLVNEALDNATDNGFFVELHLEHTVEKVAVDLATYDSDLENVSVQDLMPCIAQWRKEHTDANSKEENKEEGTS